MCSIGCSVYGDIRIVNYDQDYDVYVITDNSIPDLKVKKVDSFPNEPGEWSINKKIQSDYKIRFVKNKADADFTIKYVDRNYGC